MDESRILGRPKSEEYWEKRYREGGKSGQGSVGLARDWKWSVIKKHVSQVEDVVDVGCGDLSFWEGRTCERYIGVDISPHIIARNAERRPEWAFVSSPAEKLLPLKGRVVLCLDVLFHILDDETAKRIMENLCEYSSEWVVIHAWWRNPFEGKVNDGIYQAYRPLDKALFTGRGFDLVEETPAPEEVNPYGAMYIFRKKAKS
ncbi:MAG TPA: methyltransferase domain-containing protein [Nitrososphaerales archaeon]